MKWKKWKNTKKTKTEFPVRGERVNTVSTVALILLMLFYLVMTLYSSARLAQQTDVISNHPFEVVISAGDVKLYLSEMRIRTERLLSHHGSDDVEIVDTALEALYASTEQSLSQIKELYLGEGKDVAALQDAVEKLRTQQEAQLSALMEKPFTDSEIEKFQKQYLQPLYDECIGKTEKIITVAKEKKVGYGRTADSLRKSTLVGSVLLMGLMIVGLLISQYVTRRQRKELLYRSQLFDNLSLSIDDAFLIRDGRSGEINYCGLNMERVTGVSAADMKEGYLGIKREEAEEIRETVTDAHFASPFEKVVEFVRPDGRTRYLLIRVYRTDNMEVPRLITVFSDRTEEIQSRQALKDAMLNAERANEAKSDFLSRMSHEIRTPLNAIIGMTAIAAASIKDAARVEDCLSKINFSSRHLLMLINDVLDMSKIESNKMILQNEPFDIFQIINGFVSTVYAQAKAKNITFEETMEGFGEDTVFVGDSLRLNQILLNLSSNAVKFTAPGGKICLKVARIASRNRMDILHFVISDTGIGMEKDALERIFQPFEQADASISGRFGGTGLGMSITRNLVMLMGGKIQVESEPGVGTSCMVDLPFERGTEGVEEPDFDSQGLHALIVDDERQVCEQSACLLEKIKICAEWTVSGEEAVRRVSETHRTGKDFDLCLIDWKMPDMDGIEVTRRIRREVGADIPIVMISAYDITEVEQEALEAGVNGFLPKPLYRSSVYATIRDTLYSRRRPEKADEAETLKKPLTGRRLLIVEDNELNMEIAVELLRMNGAETDCAHDGREAVDKFLSSRPGEYDAILMDVQMPVMNGYEAARKIRTSAHPMAATVPIIATTANAFSGDISAALAAGMNAHVSKPLDMDQLCRVLVEYINKTAEKEKG